MVQKQRYCRECQRNTLFSKPSFTFGWGCLLTVLTGLIFLPVWILISSISGLRPSRCQRCGSSHGSWPRRGVNSPAPAVPQVVIVQQPYQPAPARLPAPPATALPELEVIDGPSVEVIPPREPLWPRVESFARESWASLVATYRSLPEWAAPIVWGLGVASPLVTLMFVARWALG